MKAVIIFFTKLRHFFKSEAFDKTIVKMPAT